MKEGLPRVIAIALPTQPMVRVCIFYEFIFQ
jgi:hypothetical protein